jgi:hypothetical protein
LETEIKLLERLEVRKARQAQTALHTLKPPALPLSGECLAEKVTEIKLPLDGLLAERIELGGQVLELESAAQFVQLHRATSS